MRLWFNKSKKEDDLEAKLKVVKNRLELIVAELDEIYNSLPQGSSTFIYIGSAIGHLKWAIAAATRR